MLLKIILVIILIYLVYKLFNKYNKKEHLDISYDDYEINPKSEEDCYKRKLTDSDFNKKVYSMNEGELIFY
jgi:hypothetical protein